MLADVRLYGGWSMGAIISASVMSGNASWAVLRRQSEALRSTFLDPVAFLANGLARFNTLEDVMTALRPVLPLGALEHVAASRDIGWFCTAERLTPEYPNRRTWTVFGNRAVRPAGLRGVNDLLPKACDVEYRFVETADDVLFAIASSICNPLMAFASQYQDVQVPVAFSRFHVLGGDVAEVLHISHTAAHAAYAAHLNPSLVMPPLGSLLESRLGRLVALIALLFVFPPPGEATNARGDVLGYTRAHSPIVRSFTVEANRYFHDRLPEDEAVRRGLQLVAASCKFQDLMEVFALMGGDVSAVERLAEEVAKVLFPGAH
jgi:hypothetical protein